MARPTKNNVDYFTHEHGMRNDRKLKAVRSKYGLEGYAIYGMLLETISEADCLLVKWEPLEIEMIAGDFGIDSDFLTEFVDYSVKINLLQMQDNFLLCRQLDNRMRYVFDKRTLSLDSFRSDNYSFRYGYPVTDPKKILKESKAKQRKGKKSINARFEEFWNLYEKKSDRYRCEKKFARLTSPEIDAVFEFVPKYVEYTPDIQFRKHPLTFLNNRIWEDDIESYKQTGNTARRDQIGQLFNEAKGE